MEKRTQTKWTAERCVQALEKFIEEKDRRPYASEMKASEGLPSPAAFQKAVGLSCVKYCKSHGYPAPPAKKPRWDADNCKDAVRRFVQENGRLPDPSHEARASFGLPTPGVFGSCTGIPMGQYMSETYPELVMPTESQWTKERIDAAAKQFFETHGRYPRAEEYNMAHGLPARNTFRNHFGIAAGTYWRERFPMEPEWSPEKVMKMFEAFIEEHARLPNIPELKTANGLSHFTTVLKHTGAASYEDFCQEYFPEFYVPHTKWDCESCIQAVSQFTHEHGRLPAAKELRLKNGLPNIQTIKKYTGSITYQEFCRKYFPEFGPRRWDRDLCIQAVDQFIQEHGRLPNIGDTGCGLPCIDTFRRLVGETPYEYFKQQYPDPVKVSDHRYLWTELKIREALDDFVRRTGRPPKSRELTKENDLPCYSVIQRTTGSSPGAFIRDWYVENYLRKTDGSSNKDQRYSYPGSIEWTEESIHKAFEGFIAEHARLPRIAELCSKNGLPNLRTALKYTDTAGYPDFCRKYFPDVPMGSRTKWDHDRCLQVIDQFIQEQGRAPRAEDAKIYGLPDHMTFQKFIGASISEYCRQQYPELVQVHRWTTQTIRKALEDFWERTGRPPLLKELVKENKLPCRSVIQRAAGMPPATFIRDWYMETHALSTREGSPGIHQRNRKWDRPEWTEENIRNAFEAFIEDHARLPHTTEVRAKNGLPSIGTILKQTGTVSYPDFCRKYFPHMPVWSRTRWDRDSCIQAIDQFIQEHGRLPRVKETRSYGLPNYTTFQNLVGESFPAYFKRLYPDLDEHRDKWTMDRICEALDNFVQREGRPPQAAELCKENELPSQPIIKRMTGMTASTFIHEWYAENYGITEQEESIGWSMQMM